MRRLTAARRGCATLAWTQKTTGINLARVPKPWKKTQSNTDDGALLIKAEQLVPAETMTKARALLLDPSLRFDSDSDSVDGSPTFEIRWAAGGQYTHDGLRAIFESVVSSQLLPLAERLANRKLVLCEALARMYDEGARRVHPAHYDGDALVTAVVEIDTGGFGGGFYVQPGCEPSSRIPISLAPGDVIAHSFDLQHGVEVASGRRCSIVFWFVPSLSACTDKSRSWYQEAAEAGDPDALYNYAKDIDRMGNDPRRAQELMRSAAEQGLPMAQNDLAAMLMAGRGCADGLPDLPAAEEWFGTCADQGFYRGMYGLAVLCSQQAGREGEALKWLRKAAEQRADPEVLHRLGVAYRHGYGAAKEDPEEAMKWFAEAAEMGHPGAQQAYGEMLLQKEEREAEEWLRRASNQLQPGAALALCKVYLRRGDAAAIGRLLGRWAVGLSTASSKATDNALARVVSVAPLVVVFGVMGVLS